MYYYIYKIENLQNHKIYIGLTNNVERRRKRHFSDLKRNVHDNHFLQMEYNQYGLSNFSFEVVWSGETNYQGISQKERDYIKKYDSYYNGYNQNEGGNFGASNGGTHLTEKDLFNILAVLEHHNRAGAVLAKMYNVTTTTISRIKKGTNHTETIQRYNTLSEKEKEQIYNKFEKDFDLLEVKAKSNKLESKRMFTKEQVFMILCNFEFKIIPTKHLCEKFGVASYTLYSIRDGISYKDFSLEYKRLNNDEKQKIVELLSN